MKNKIIGLCILASMLFACQKTMITGRKQLSLIPASQLNALSFSQYRQFINENNTMKSGPELERVRRISTDLIEAVKVYYHAEGRSSDLNKFKWEVNVVNDPSVNAFCMPGGKIVVYTGILPVAKNDDGLAAILGHEIAHALANHGGERMSQGLVAQVGLASLDVALSQKPAATRNLFMAAAGAGTQVGVLLPFSRKHESEADEIGLYLSAMAGYNPSEAEQLWYRMAAAGGSGTPAFLSTHPDPKRRAKKLKSMVPAALRYKRKYPVPKSSRNKN